MCVYARWSSGGGSSRAAGNRHASMRCNAMQINTYGQGLRVSLWPHVSSLSCHNSSNVSGSSSCPITGLLHTMTDHFSSASYSWALSQAAVYLQHFVGMVTGSSGTGNMRNSACARVCMCAQHSTLTHARPGSLLLRKNVNLSVNYFKTTE